MTDPAPTTRAEAKARATHTPNRWVPNPAIRAWLYRIIAAAGPIVVFYGLMSADEAALWTGLGATILGTPTATLAAANTPK